MKKKFPVHQVGLALSLLLLFGSCETSRTRGADGAPAQEELSDDQMVQKAQELSDLRQQKTQLLVSERVNSALVAYGDGRLDEAEADLVAALQLDPASQDALNLLDEVRVAQGRAASSITGTSDDARLRLQARMQKVRADTEATAEEGLRQLQGGQYDEAIGSFRLAQATITTSSYKIDWGGLPGRVADGLEQALELRDLEKAARLDQERRTTYDKLQAQEAAAAEARRQRANMMLADAVRAFDVEDYERTIQITTDVLRKDPLNERAVELRDSAYRARHERVSENFVAQRRERFRLWLEDMEEIRVPVSDIFVAPDPEYWARISELRKGYRDLDLSVAESEENIEVSKAIQTTKIPGVRFDGETSLEAVINQLQTFTDIPFVVTPDAVEAVDAEGIEFNIDLGHEITVENALNVITESAGPEVTYTFRHGVVYVTTVTRAQGSLELVAHDVQDLTAQLVDQSGPQIAEIHLPDATSIGVEEEEPEFGGVVGEPHPLMNPDNLEVLIRQTIAPLSWDDVEGVSIRYSNGFLIVVHTAEVQLQIHEFLNSLRRYISSVVTIEARFLTIQKDFLNEIGVDFRGLGGTFAPPTDLVTLDDVTSGLVDNASAALDNSGPGLPAGAESNPSAGAFLNEFLDGDIRARTENVLTGGIAERLSNLGGLTMQLVFLDDVQTSVILRAVEKSNRAQELMSNTLSVQNTGRGYVTVLNQVTYVQDFEVEVAQAAIIADPVVGVVSDGIVLDVRPTISNDRRHITLELRPTVASLLRPIPEFTSSLAGLTTPVTLQLPEIQVSSANTTVVVPDGGTVVIGGLKKLLDVDERAEVPFLGSIPILGFLFKSESQISEKQDVIILVKATITDIREATAKLEAGAGR